MKKTFMTAAVALATTLGAAPAFAGTPIPQLAGPGILGLVALGVIGAIAVGRWRK